MDERKRIEFAYADAQIIRWAIEKETARCAHPPSQCTMCREREHILDRIRERFS